MEITQPDLCETSTYTALVRGLLAGFTEVYLSIVIGPFPGARSFLPTLSSSSLTDIEADSLLEIYRFALAGLLRVLTASNASNAHDIANNSFGYWTGTRYYPFLRDVLGFKPSYQAQSLPEDLRGQLPDGKAEVVWLPDDWNRLCQERNDLATRLLVLFRQAFLELGKSLDLTLSGDVLDEVREVAFRTFEYLLTDLFAIWLAQVAATRSLGLIGASGLLQHLYGPKPE